tara:strand:+ start:168 stop:887 length:720 start_codon:yes stop_codon:yes gene_type:complete
VEKIKNIRILSLWIFILPVVALNLCLFISVNYHLLENTIFIVDQIGRTGFTIPYIDGGVSISRTARTYPTYLVFKPCMIVTGILLIKYWISTNALIKNINNETDKNKRFLIFGILSAIFLIFHSIFLGISFEHDLYKFFRRFLILGFIIFEIIAQALLVIVLFKIKRTISKIIRKNVLILKILLVSILSITALASLPILTTSGHTHFKHALEWNYFIGVVLFYLLTFCFWKDPQKNQKL